MSVEFSLLISSFQHMIPFSIAIFRLYLCQKQLPRNGNVWKLIGVVVFGGNVGKSWSNLIDTQTAERVLPGQQSK